MSGSYQDAIDWMARNDDEWIDAVSTSLWASGNNRESSDVARNFSSAARLTAHTFRCSLWSVFEDTRKARAEIYQAARRERESATS